MVYVPRSFASWLIRQGSKRLGEYVLGTEQERALEQAASAAIKNTADDLCDGHSETSNYLAMVVDQVFTEPLHVMPPTDHETLLQALQRGISRQLAALGDASITGVGESSVELFGLDVTDLADSLTYHLVREISERGATGGPLTALADQLNHDLTHLQGQDIQGMIRQLVRKTAESRSRSERQISARLPDLHYGRILIPNAAMWRLVNDTQIGSPPAPPSFLVDTSMLYYLIEEFVRFGAMDVAVEAYRYANVLSTIPVQFSNRIIEVDNAASTTAMLEIIRPVATEHNIEITASVHGVEKVRASLASPPLEVSASLRRLMDDLEIFIRGMRHGLLVALNLKRMQKSVRMLLDISTSQESRANLVILEQIFSTYRPHRVGAVRMISAAPARMVDYFEELVGNPLYQEMSQQVPSMGLIGQSAEGARAVTQAAKRLSRREEKLSFGGYSAFLPSASLRVDNFRATDYFKSPYFPPIISMKKAIKRARATWEQLTPEIIPMGRYPSTESFVVGQVDLSPSFAQTAPPSMDGK